MAEEKKDSSATPNQAVQPSDKYNMIDALVRGWILTFLGIFLIVAYILVIFKSEKFGINKADLPEFIFHPITAGVILVVGIWLMVTKPTNIEKETNSIIDKISDKFFKKDS